MKFERTFFYFTPQYAKFNPQQANLGNLPFDIPTKLCIIEQPWRRMLGLLYVINRLPVVLPVIEKNSNFPWPWR